MKILIQNGEIVNAAETFKADLLIDGEKIVAVGHNLPTDGVDKIYDAKGKYVMPGGIDVHCHLAMPFMGTVSKDDFSTGTKCAVAGGTTSVIEFCLPAKGQSLKDALEVWDAKSKGLTYCDYSFHMAITDWNESIRSELDMCFERGITSFKVFTAYKGALMISDEAIFELMLEVRQRGGLVTAHAVNGDVLNALATRFATEGKLTPHYHPLCQPPYAEGEATGRILELGYLADQPAYIVHMTARESVEELARARTRGWESYGETCPQYLVLDDSVYDLPNFEGAKYVLSPPIRKKHDQEALWGALANGIIQTVGTDHCTFDFKGQKDMGRDDFRKIPNGLNGLEERINMMYTYGVCRDRITINRMVEVCCTNPAKLFGLYPNKGTIAPGSDADVMIYDPSYRGTISAKTHHSAGDSNVYEGMEIEGRPSHVFVRGL
ncbi:MAG: dihydropyrimidinase, partial [Candidatus Eremiobacteraeota bacterium]|nr:dihydropyrimidinase [Candidatus Eremiobacteraeota bacterium]